MTRKITSFAIVAVMLMAISAPAFGQANATQDTYGNQAGALQGGGGGTSPSAADTGGSLPFTGLELTAMIIVGLGLAGTGYMIRRASGPSTA